VAQAARTSTTSRQSRLPVSLTRLRPDESFKTRAYAALKQAIVKMDIYATADPVMLDEREISERIGVSRTPVREAIAMLEQDGFVRVVPRRGILVVRKTKREIIEMVQAWAALESMAVRLLVAAASDAEIATLRDLMRRFDADHTPDAHLGEYSAANLEFHQRIIALSKSGVLAEMTDNLLLHVRGIRALTIGRHDRAGKSIVDHLAIIDAIERRDVDTAERLARKHTLGLAAYVEAHGDELFG
jgi:DNA-binding GntR family transcriptional regulator